MRENTLKSINNLQFIETKIWNEFLDKIKTVHSFMSAITTYVYTVHSWVVKQNYNFDVYKDHNKFINNREWCITISVRTFDD